MADLGTIEVYDPIQPDILTGTVNATPTSNPNVTFLGLFYDSVYRGSIDVIPSEATTGSSAVRYSWG